jgi:hypothetical protein
MKEPVTEVIRPTTFIEAPRLGRRLGVELIIARACLKIE